MSTAQHLQLLAQDTVAVDAVLQYFASVVLTPLGLAALSAGGLFVAVVLFVRKGVPVLSASTMVLLTMMIHESTLTKNILVGPLNSLRSISRPISFALMAAASLAALAVPLGDRLRTVSFPALAMYLFQLYYAVNLMFFVETLKGMLALFSISAMFLVCVVGFGRRMQDVASARRTIEVFAWVGIAFCGMNLLQLALGPGSAVLGGRFAGISGNAQQAGAVCAALLITNLYLFGDLPASRPLKWIAAAVAGIVGLLLIWTGSRTSVLSAGIGILLMYRFQLGRAVIAACSAGMVLAIALTVFQDSSEGLERILSSSTGDTRAAVFSNALADWMSSPIIGVMPFGYENGVESSYLRALANLGIVGGIVLLVPFGAMGISMFRILWIGRSNPEPRRLCDLYFGMIGSFVIMNILEGFAFGVLTFPMMTIYVILALGGFLTERYSMAGMAALQDLDDWETSPA
jgi:hypothetical protein